MGFEENIKQVLEDYTVPYNSADWAQMEKSLDGSSRKGNFSGALFYGALLTVAISFTGVLWFMDIGSDDLEQDGVATVEQAEVNSTTNGSDENSRSSIPPVSGNNDYSKNNPEKDPDSGLLFGIENTDNSDEPDTDVIENPGSQTIDPNESEVNASRSDKGGDHFNKLNTVKSKTDQNKNKNTKDPIQAHSGSTKSGNEGPEPSSSEIDDMAVSFSANISEACPGSSIDFKVNEIPEGSSFLWNFGDGSFSNKPDPQHEFDKPGIYEVTLLITPIGGGTKFREPARDVIQIHDQPYADFSWELLAESNEIPVIHFENTSQNGVVWEWDLGDGNSSKESHPEHIYKKKGSYQVTLKATNPLGCEDLITRNVEVKNDYKLLATRSFSPNDDGHKDIFIPDALSILDVNFKMTIYQKETGRQIYETGDINAPWNGRLNNTGAACEEGDYIWLIDILDGFNAQESYNGEVTLLR